jgi:Nucleotidyl transferase AbiEii toxin, Type IV TA system
VSLGELSAAQRDVLDRLAASELADIFYLSGGTALAAFYLHHRQSEDLDLFSRQRFDPASVLDLVNAVSEAEPMARRVHDRLGFVLRVRGEPLRVEFAIRGSSSRPGLRIAATCSVGPPSSTCCRPRCSARSGSQAGRGPIPPPRKKRRRRSFASASAD